jgi:hypothetical protein
MNAYNALVIYTLKQNDVNLIDWLIDWLIGV